MELVKAIVRESNEVSNKSPPKIFIKVKFVCVEAFFCTIKLSEFFINQVDL